jgi:MFS family permease
MISKSLRRISNNPALQLKDYRRVWAGALFNMVGMAGEQVIVGYLIYELTNSTSWVGISLALYFCPMLFFGAPAGVLADRIERKKLLPIFELGITVLLGCYALIFFTSEPSLIVFLVITFASGSLRAVQSPIRLSYIYDLVGSENIVPSLGLLNLGIRTGQLVGATVTGIALKFSGPALAFAILCLGHGVAFILLSSLSSAGRSKDFQPASITEEFREYWNELSSNRSLQLIILVTACIEIFGFSFVTALPEIAKTKLDIDAAGLGFMHTARAAGGMLAGIALASTLNLGQKGRIYMAVTFGFGLFVTGLGLSPNYGFALIAIAAIAAMAAVTDVLSQSMMQMVVPDKLRGRAMGAWVFAIGIAPFGHIEAGFLSELIGADKAMILNGIGLMITTVLVLVIAPGKIKSL